MSRLHSHERIDTNTHFSSPICAFSEDEFKMVKAKEYGQSLLQGMDQAQSRIWLQSMNMENDHMAGLIFHTMMLKAEQGLDVRLNIDGFNDMVTDGHLNVISVPNSAERNYRLFRKESKRRILHALSLSGVQVTQTNWPVPAVRHFFPPVERNHIKLALIDETAYLGGINLSDKDFLREDSMLKITNPSLLKGMASIFELSRSSDKRPSGIVAETETSQLLFDGNSGESSVILKKVREVALRAKSSVIICTQFAPDMFLVNLLRELEEKNIPNRLIVSDPKYISEGNAWIFDRFDRLRARYLQTPLTLFPGWLHAKVVLVDQYTDSSTAIYGTHNFVGKGSSWKNEELALLSTDPQVIGILQNYVGEIIQACRR